MRFILTDIACSGEVTRWPEIYISQDFARKVAVFISGESNIETLYDAYFYMDVVVMVSITTAVYLITMKLIKK